MVQHSLESFCLRDYEVRNWLEDVDVFKIKWNHAEIRKINESILQLVFKKRVRPFTYAAELGLDQLGDLSGMSRHDWNKNDQKKLLLERYRLETTHPSATSIDWSKLDRKEISSRYDPFPINCATMKIATFFRNPEIIDNIHFSKERSIPQSKRRRKLEEIEDADADESLKVSRQSK